MTVAIKETLQGGIPIGQGKCGAVRLKLNVYQRNSLILVGTPDLSFLVYYGDSQSQENELFAFGNTQGAGQFFSFWTPKIYCENLEEVFVRYGGQTQGGNGWPETAQVQVMILSNE